MRLFEALAGIFIDTFGITQPTDKTRRQAAWFILGLLALVLCGLVAAGLLISHLLRA